METKTPMDLANGNKNPNVIGQLKPIPQFNDKNENFWLFNKILMPNGSQNPN